MIYKTKAQVREEMEKQLKEFLRRGGSVEVAKTRKAPASARTWMKR
jgi:hypothetical protein